MKLAVVGSRNFNDYELLKFKLDTIHSVKPISLIVSGGAAGADSLSEKWAKENNVPTKIFIPDWDRFGKSAGYKRNVQIVCECDSLIAFWDGESKGTQHSINLAKEKLKPTAIIKF
jgi:hypothetical protein